MKSRHRKTNIHSTVHCVTPMLPFSHFFFSLTLSLRVCVLSSLYESTQSNAKTRRGFRKMGKVVSCVCRFVSLMAMASLAPKPSLSPSRSFLCRDLALSLHILPVKLKTQSYSVSFCHAMCTLAHSLAVITPKKRMIKNYIYIAFESWQFITYSHSFILFVWFMFPFFSMPIFMAVLLLALILAAADGGGGGCGAAAPVVFSSSVRFYSFIIYSICIVEKPHQY